MSATILIINSLLKSFPRSASQPFTVFLVQQNSSACSSLVLTPYRPNYQEHNCQIALYVLIDIVSKDEQGMKFLPDTCHITGYMLAVAGQTSRSPGFTQYQILTTLWLI